MQTSAMPRRERHAEAGISLVEVLVVLSVIAVVSGLAMLQFGAGRSASLLDMDATRIAAEVGGASDQALFSGVERLVSWQDDRLAVSGNGASGTVFSLADGVEITTPPGQHRLSALGLSLPLTLVLAMGETRRQIYYDGASAVVLTERVQ